jgi:fructosamine-3-kinase
MSQQPFREHLQERFSGIFSSPVSILALEPIHGGDINQSYLVKTSEGDYFLKSNSDSFGKDMLEKEAKGLLLILEAGCMRVPQPVFYGEFRHQIYLVMEFLKRGMRKDDFWEDFGRALAELHGRSNTYFGLEYDNYIGSLPQSNQIHSNWADFLAEERILKLVSKAVGLGQLQIAHVRAAENICRKLNNIFPDSRPSLIHGDLWAGNFLVGEDGHALIFDPAVYYGHREMDIAMSQLFGGFENGFYRAYNHHFPLDPGYTDRTALCQLYPLLVHLILFGGHYYGRVKDILDKYQ